MSPWQLETVAGLVDPGESYEAVARRETREETGLDIVGELVPIQRYLPSCGHSDETVVLFCGRVDSAGAGGTYGLPEEHEDIRVVIKSLAELEAMLDAGQIETGHTLACVYWLFRQRALGRPPWGAAASA
jgi:ADP-ribose pyrophosphatase